MQTIARQPAADSTFGLIDRVRRQCRDFPDALAIESVSGHVTYGQLAARADGVAGILQSADCAPGDVVAVMVAERAALISIMVGVLQAGCIFVPLNDDAPAERLRHVIAQLQPKLFLTTDFQFAAVTSLAAALGGGAAVVRVPTEVDKIAEAEGTSAGIVSSAGRFAQPGNTPSYVYFTSGSAGVPKGIAGSLHSLAKRIAWEIDTFQIPRGYRVSQLVAATFDAWFRDVFVPLCAGGTICIPPERPARMRPESLLQWLRDTKINLMHCGPTLLNTLVSTPPRIRRLPDLRLVLLSGEFLHVSLVARWRRRFGSAMRLVNLYGPTEATMVQFYHIVEAADLKRDFIPVGRALPEVDILLVDEQNNRCAPGQAGEILIGGSTLSLGYFRDEEATRKAFVELAEPDGSRMTYYRSGDIGVEFAEATYRLLGRRDDQVKIRGVRVEPREVEDALIGYPLVAACATTVHRGEDGEPSLVAYVLPETEYPPAIPEMRAYLRERLPLESIPGKFVLLTEIPLTETGKIDRSKLPDPGLASQQGAEQIVAPRDPVETALAEYWCEILGLSQVGVRDHFLDLGGHSLSAMRLINQLRLDLGIDLSVEDVLNNPTIEKLALRIKDYSVPAPPRMPDRSIPGSSARLSSSPAAATTSAMPTAASDFACPEQPSPLFGRRRCNLVLVLGDYADGESFEKVSRWAKEFDPAIQTEIVEDRPGWSVDLPIRPTLLFSPALMRNRPRIPGRIVCGYPLSKSEEYTLLAKAGIAVPRWTLLREGDTPNLDGFGDYVVRKPDYGAKGAEVRIIKRERVRWRRVVTSAAGPSPTLLVQEFIYTGPRPVSFRVNTLFGRVLYCMRNTGNADRPALRGPNDFDARGPGNSVSIVSNVRDSTAEFCNDAEIIRFGERAASAFPDLPILGIDVLQEADSGRLFVIEVNSLGHNWNFSKKFRENFGIDVTCQFNGLRKAAYLLAEKTQELANLDHSAGGE